MKETNIYFKSMQDQREKGKHVAGKHPDLWFQALSVSTKILLAFLFLTVIFTATSGYSLLKHHAVASELRLISRGYLKMAFAIVEMRTTQRLQAVQLENLMEEDSTFVQGWISSVRRIRPIVLQNLGRDVDDLMKITKQPEERGFLAVVKRDIEGTQGLYAEAEKYYTTLSVLMENGPNPEAEEILKLLKEEEEKIGANLRHLQSISIQRIHKVTARSEQAETRTLWMLSALILLTVSISLLTTYLIHRLLMPLGEIRRGVEIIGKGNLDYRLDVRRPDEIGRFAGQLNVMAEELQERDRRLILTERLAGIGKMASHIAHEVKNPLSSIGLNTELAIEEAREIAPAEKQQEILSLMKSISQEVDRVANLINHYLQMGRPPKPQKLETNLSALLDEVREFMAPEMKEHEAQVRLIAPAEPLTAAIDRDQIKQVIINLLKNALEAMDKPMRRIDITLDRVREHARIIMSDTGRGMDPAECERIFEPFYSSKKGGSGLGLPITRQIILDHKGSIECTSEKGAGTKFEITLPLK
jgi:two-component system NtrC family sensor kinase